MNILILTGKFGMGHASVAGALTVSLEQQVPGAKVSAIDLPTYLSKDGANLWYRLFGTLVARMSPLYNAYYKMSALSDSGKTFSLLRVFQQKADRLFREKQPDVVIAVHPICAYLASQCKKAGQGFTLITCLTDLSTHPEWVNPYTDYYCVGARDIALSLQSYGVAPEQILMTGVPLRQEFYTATRDTSHERLELLLMGGGLGLLPPEPSFYQGLSKLPGVHATVITGRNHKLYQRLAGRFEGLTVLGYTSNVRDYMQKADLMISKAGGITLFEAIYTGLPLLIPEPALEQETRNAAFAEAHGIALLAPREPNGCLDAIARLTSNPNQLQRMSEAARCIRENLRPTALVDLLSALSEKPKGGTPYAA